MANKEPQPETAEDTVQEPEDEKLLEDLDPEEEAADVQGGARRAGGRYGTL